MMKFFNIYPLSKRQWNNRVFLVSLFLGLILLTIFVDPRNVSMLACRFKSMSGANCPTCGISRSFYAFSHLHIAEAFSYHLLGPVLYLSILILSVKSAVELFLKKELKTILNPVYLKIFLILTVIAWLGIWLNNFI